MAGRLQDKTALVTGATSNIGRAIAEAFAAEGAHVVISGRSAQRGAQIVEGIRSRGGRADFVIAELCHDEPAALTELDRSVAPMPEEIELRRRAIQLAARPRRMPRLRSRRRTDRHARLDFLQAVREGWRRPLGSAGAVGRLTSQDGDVDRCAKPLKNRSPSWRAWGEPRARRIRSFHVHEHASRYRDDHDRRGPDRRPDRVRRHAVDR